MMTLKFIQLIRPYQWINMSGPYQFEAVVWYIENQNIIPNEYRATCWQNGRTYFWNSDFLHYVHNIRDQYPTLRETKLIDSDLIEIFQNILFFSIQSNYGHDTVRFWFNQLLKCHRMFVFFFSDSQEDILFQMSLILYRVVHVHCARVCVCQNVSTAYH